MRDRWLGPGPRRDGGSDGGDESPTAHAASSREFAHALSRDVERGVEHRERAVPGPARLAGAPEDGQVALGAGRGDVGDPALLGGARLLRGVERLPVAQRVLGVGADA